MRVSFFGLIAASACICTALDCTPAAHSPVDLVVFSYYGLQDSPVRDVKICIDTTWIPSGQQPRWVVIVVPVEAARFQEMYRAVDAAEKRCAENAASDGFTISYYGETKKISERNLGIADGLRILGVAVPFFSVKARELIRSEIIQRFDQGRLAR